MFPFPLGGRAKKERGERRSEGRSLPHLNFLISRILLCPPPIIGGGERGTRARNCNSAGNSAVNKLNNGIPCC